MSRSTKPSGSRRYFVTLSQHDSTQLEAYAVSVSRRPTTVASELLLAGLAAATDQAGEELAGARRRIQELEHQLAAVFAAKEAPELRVSAPRWEWPVEELLADRAWWDRWLPRLYELLGRSPNGLALATAAALPTDGRGYVDLMVHLLPTVTNRGEEITWRSVEYPCAAVLASERSASERMPTQACWQARPEPLNQVRSQHPALILARYQASIWD